MSWTSRPRIVTNCVRSRNRPRQAQIGGYPLLYLLRVDRRGEVKVETGGFRSLFVVILTPTGDREQQYATSPGLLADAARYLVAGDIRHAHVQNKHLGVLPDTEIQRLLAVVGNKYVVARKLQQHLQAVGGVPLVVGDDKLAAQPMSH